MPPWNVDNAVPSVVQARRRQASSASIYNLSNSLHVKHSNYNMKFHYASQTCISNLRKLFRQCIDFCHGLHFSLYVTLTIKNSYITLSLHADEVDSVLELKVHFDEPTPTCSDFLVSCLEMLLSTLKYIGLNTYLWIITFIIIIIGGVLEKLNETSDVNSALWPISFLWKSSSDSTVVLSM